ncbi:MAG: NAD(+)/NADH kinase [Clostridia bacterium]|nr:NAD(+)/NADH kinase [Clostridia bacterium]
MKVFICPNNRTSVEIEKAKECFDILQKLGHECSCSEDTFIKLSIDKKQSFSPSDSDIILSLGGDGSVLRASRVAIENSKPLVGVNSGRLGYLCAMNFEDLKDFDNLFKNMHMSERTLLSINYDGKESIAINDIIVAKKNFGATVDLSIEIVGMEKRKIRGDGLVISTPTGSTAYNYSAGGPEIASDVPCFTLTAICPHDVGQKSYVISDSKTIMVSERDNMAELYCDGVLIGDIKNQVKIAKANVTLQMYTK